MSLLLFSGFIIPFYRAALMRLSPATVPIQCIAPQPTGDLSAVNSFFYNDVLKNIFPVLKNLN